jgi:hypothetical protein
MWEEVDKVCVNALDASCSELNFDEDKAVPRSRLVKAKEPADIQKPVYILEILHLATRSWNGEKNETKLPPKRKSFHLRWKALEYGSTFLVLLSKAFVIIRIATRIGPG